MKKIKFNLSNIEGKLSKVEMKQILGGCCRGKSGFFALYPRVSEKCCPDRERVYHNGKYIGCNVSPYAWY